MSRRGRRERPRHPGAGPVQPAGVAIAQGRVRWRVAGRRVAAKGAGRIAVQALKRFMGDEKLGLYAMVFLANMGWGVMSPVLADVKTEFAISVAEVALANSIFGVARLVLDVPIGLVMDRVNQKWLRLAGAAVLAVGSVLCAMAPSFPVLLAGRFLNGVGAAVIQVTNLVWISRLSSEDRRGRDLGIYQAVFQAGMSVSPMAGGLLADLSGGGPASGSRPGPRSWVSCRCWWGRRAGSPRSRPRAVPPGARSAPESTVRQHDPGRARRALWVANLVTLVSFFSVGGFQNTIAPLFGSTVLDLDAGDIGLALGFR